MLDIVKKPDPILTKQCETVDFSSVRDVEMLRKTIPQMKILIKQHGALGVAAPQIGISKRFFVMKPANVFVVCVNSQIIHLSDEETSVFEGCLSIPKFKIKVTRPERIFVHYYDEKGKLHGVDAAGMWARVFQHEHDHTMGVLIG